MIEAYLAGQLDTGSVRGFRAHLDRCKSCASSLRDVERSVELLRFLRPEGCMAPQPGPEFYSKVQASIEKRLDNGWFGSFAISLQTPRFVFPILFLFVGLLVSVWSVIEAPEWGPEGIMGIPQRRFSETISSETGRDMVMVSLVDEMEQEGLTE